MNEAKWSARSSFSSSSPACSRIWRLSRLQLSDSMTLSMPWYWRSETLMEWTALRFLSRLQHHRLYGTGFQNGPERGWQGPDFELKIDTRHDDTQIQAAPLQAPECRGTCEFPHPHGPEAPSANPRQNPVGRFRPV